MARKRILFRSKARECVLHGAIRLVDSVRITLGLKSRSVRIQRCWGVPIVGSAGLTIAKAFHLADDPTKVVRIALENAETVAGVLLLKATMTGPPEPIGERACLPEEP